jgi:excisionase family DNA binding protein
VGEDQRPGADQAATDQTTGRKLTVSEAAEALGISADAVRSRIKRGTLPTVHEGGRVFVLVESVADDRPTAQAQPTNRPGEDLLYQEMQDRIRYLERQVEEEREARRRADTLLARLMDRMPEIEAPAEPPPDVRESPETVEEQQGRGQPRSEAPGPQEDVRRPWWRRVFGG